MSNDDLINRALSLISHRTSKDSSSGDVGCALVSNDDQVYAGVCVDTGSGMGYCAELNAIGSMITDKQYVLKKIVAVWKDKEGNGYVLPPCGKCREFMKQIDAANLETEVIVAPNRSLKLKELLPLYDSWERIS